jgi:putative glutamine amidotransferase
VGSLTNEADRKPLLGVIACNRIVGGEIASSVMRRYLEAAGRYMNASLLVIPSLPDFVDVPRLASMLDGCLLTGSPSNVTAKRYGLDDPTAQGPFDEERDEVVFRMVHAMIGAGKPVFGICRGLQEINVTLGGTLRLDLRGGAKVDLHHAPADADQDQTFGYEHEVSLTPGGILASALSKDRIAVNSVHYQGIDRIAQDLKVEATAADGLVEACSAQIGCSTILAVQWHPEWRTASNAQSRAIFEVFGKVLRDCANSRCDDAFTSMD